MKTLIKTNIQLNPSRANSKTSQLAVKENSLITIIDYKFYQKLLMVLISFFIFLIFPESPKELEAICDTYYSSQKCNVV